MANRKEANTSRKLFHPKPKGGREGNSDGWGANLLKLWTWEDAEMGRTSAHSRQGARPFFFCPLIYGQRLLVYTLGSRASGSREVHL